MGKMKGQFFIIGALLICVLLFFGTVPEIILIDTAADDMIMFSENLEAEIPHALNIGINGSDPLGVLYNFTIFSRDVAARHRMNLTGFWAVVFPQGDNINVSVGNFMLSGKDFGINISGNYSVLQAGSDSVNSSLYTISDYKLDFNITVGSGTAGARMLVNKTSIYMDISLGRGGDVVKKEILA